MQQKKLRVFWTIIVIIVILSMVLFSVVVGLGL